MKIRDTLYEKSSIDFRKVLVYIVIIFLNVFAAFQSSSAFSFVILMQGVCNIDGFWDFIDNERICRPLTKMIKLLIALSALGILLALLNLMLGEVLFDNPLCGYILRILALFTISFPIVILYKDYKKNVRIEEQRRGKEQR